MPFTFTVSDADILADASEALFKISLKMAHYQSELYTKLAGKQVEISKYRGTVTNIVSNRVTVKDEKGDEKTFTMSSRVRAQLAEHTTRK